MRKYQSSPVLKLSILLSASLIATGALSTTRLCGQQIGDRVVVTVPYKTKIYDKQVGEVFAGTVHTVIAVDGKWIAFNDVRGWLPARYAMSLDEGLKQYSKRAKDNERDADAFATRGVIYLERKDYQKSFNDLNHALTINKKAPAVWNNRGIVYMSMGKLDQAFADIEYAIKLSPKFSEAHSNLGIVLLKKKEYEKAETSFQAAIDLAPKNAWNFVNRAAALNSLGKYDRALSDYNKAIGINPGIAEAYVGRSNVYLHRDDLERAAADCEMALKVAPNSAVAYNNRGWLQYRQQNFTRALADFDKAIKLDATEPTVYSNRGVVLVELSKFDSAIEDYNRALEMDAESPVFWSNRGTAFLNKGDFAKATEDFNKALQLDPELSESLNQYAWFLATCPDESVRDSKRAIELAEKAVAHESGENWNLIDTLAAAYAADGDFAKAVEHQTKALALAPQSKKKVCEERLALYNDEKPFLSQFGKSSESSQP